MTAKQAYALLQARVPGVKVGKCYEYKSLFVFHLAPDMLMRSKNPAPMLDGLLSVDKKTGEVRDFKPFRIPLEEYKAGVEVSRSAYK